MAVVAQTVNKACGGHAKGNGVDCNPPRPMLASLQLTALEEVRAPLVQGHHPAHPIHIQGRPISGFSRFVITHAGEEAGLHHLTITSVARTVEDQARIFYVKHVVHSVLANYKNRQVRGWIEEARKLHRQGATSETVTAFLAKEIYHAHGGIGTVSRHLLNSALLEVFDLGYCSSGRPRHYFMSRTEGQRLLSALRKRAPWPIRRIGHDEDFAVEKNGHEFLDNNCFHLEIAQPNLRALLTCAWFSQGITGVHNS